MKRSLFLLLLLSYSISTYAQIPNTLTSAEKVYGLSKFWQEVNYNFVYIDKVDSELWEAKYRELIETISNTKNDYEYYRELQKFCAILKDGHTGVYFPDQIESKIAVNDFGDYKLFLDNIEGKAIVIRTNFSKRNEIPVGSEVIEVNGMNTAAYINQFVAPYISSSTSHVRENMSIYKMLMGFEGDRYTVKIKRPNGKIVTLNLKHEKSEEKEVFPNWDQDNGIFKFKWAANGIAYVGLHSFEDASVVKQFLEELPEISKAKGIILDVRRNGGGSSVNAKNILKYFIDGNLIYGAKNFSRLHIPTDKAIGSFLQPQDTIEGKKEWGLSKQQTIDYFNAFKGSRFHAFDYSPDTIDVNRTKIIVPTVILTGNSTASAAEDFLIFADGQKHIKRIGEKTNGSTGQPYLIDLPGNGSAWICTKKVVYADGREFVGLGILPHIEVKRTVKDLLNGKDAALEKAVADIKLRM